MAHYPFDFSSKLKSFFDYGFKALYLNSAKRNIPCKIFLDIGWREHISGYDSYPGEHMILISILLQDIPTPKIGDKVIVGSQKYEVVAIQAQDDVVAVLNVKAL